MIGLLVIVGLVVVGMGISTAVTKARKVSNASVRTSLQIRSTRPASDLGSIVGESLRAAGLSKVGSFDGTQFFRLNATTQLEVKVRPTDGGSSATVRMPSVRSTNGRPQRLSPVGVALERARASICSCDPTADVR